MFFSKDVVLIEIQDKHAKLKHFHFRLIDIWLKIANFYSNGR